MIIHYYTQFFPGPDSPGSFRHRRLVQLLADGGHQVEVIACDHMDDIDASEEVHQSPSGGFFRVHRLKAARGMRVSLLARMRTYLGFAWRALFFGLRLDAPEIVIASIQPMFTGCSAKMVASRRRVPFILDVRDLWPDALEVKGAVKGWKARVLRKIVNHLYKSADRIVSITPGIKTELIKKGLQSSNIDVFPNGFDPELFHLEEGTEQHIRDRYNWGDSFVVLYTGTHTEVTAIDVIVRAAACLKKRQDIRFDLFGKGQTKTTAIALAKELGLQNIHFHDPVSKTEVPGLIAACDIAVMTLFRSPLIDIYFQNKFIDYLGSGRAIVAAMEGQQADILKRCNAGKVVSTYDYQGLSQLIEEAADNPQMYQQMGENGKSTVHRSLLLSDILERYCKVIESVAAGKAREIPAWEPELGT